MIDFINAKNAFETYLDGYDRTNDKINLKIVHTYGVMDASFELARRMSLSPEDTDLAGIIALLHDIGRFEQLKRFDSFQPDTMDHAAYGAELLFKEGMIRQFVEDSSFDSIIRDAILYHSMYQLPELKSSQALLHAKLIRDADKLDNCRVKLQESVETLLGASKEEVGKTSVTSKVAETFFRNECILSSDRVTKMDYWVSYIAYFFDINFSESLSIIQEQDFVSRIIHRIPYSDPDTALLMSQMEHYMNEYVKKGARIPNENTCN